MQHTKLTLWQKSAIWISLLLHLFLLLSFSVLLSFKPTQNEPPELYIPSYTSRDTQKENQQPVQPTKEQPQKKVEQADKDGIKKPNPTKTPPAREARKEKRQLETNDNQPSVTKAMEGVHLIGKKKLDDPLIKILGIALGHHLIYPRIALDFHLTGTSYIGFTIRPDGILTGVKLMKSSNAGVLDEEALRAVKSMSPVRGVDEYVKEPKFLVVGIIFG